MSQPNKYYHFVNYSNTLHSHKFLVFIPAVALLGILALISVFFVSADTASNSYATSVESEITAEIDGTHYVTLSAPDVTFSITPSSTAQLSKQNINVNVETNATGGADLYLAMSGNTNALHLNGDTTSTAPAIEATTSPVAANSLAANTWGYSTDDQTYSAVPTSDSDPALLANVDGSTVGTTTSDVITASVPVYYAAKVDTSIQPGSYSNRVTYSAVTDGGIVTEATLTSIKVDGQEVEELQSSKENVLVVTTNLMTQPYGTPRVYYRTTNPSGYAECGNVVVSSNESGHMTVQCAATPTQGATGVTLYIVPRGSENDIFCADGTYPVDSNQCEAGEWKWGEFSVGLPDIIGKPDINNRPSSFRDIQIMQHMTPEICASASVGDTKQLIDWRDGKTYWVAKLSDGNCWMTQNLDLDLVSGQPLDADLTNIESDWSPDTTVYTAGNQGTHDDDVAQSWDLGEAVWKSLSNSNSCFPSTNLYDSSCDAYWQNVSSSDLYTWYPMTEYRTDGTIIEGNTYDAHYLIGNYYNFEAATAGTAHSSWNGAASGSICPKGFALPSGLYSTSNDGFYGLLNQYGLANKPTSGSNNIVNAPLFFVRGGSVNPTYNLAGAGEEGRYWTRDISSGYGRLMEFDSSTVKSYGYNLNKFVGLSVRCVAFSN